MIDRTGDTYPLKLIYQVLKYANICVHFTHVAPFLPLSYHHCIWHNDTVWFTKYGTLRLMSSENSGMIPKKSALCYVVNQASSNTSLSPNRETTT